MKHVVIVYFGSFIQRGVKSGGKRRQSPHIQKIKSKISKDFVLHTTATNKESLTPIFLISIAANQYQFLKDFNKKKGCLSQQGFSLFSMRKLWPNVDQEDGLDTVLEVPIPDEMFNRMGSNAVLRWRNMCALMKSQSTLSKSASRNGNNNPKQVHNAELQLLLNVVGSPLLPLQVFYDALNRPIKACSIQASTAKYIIQQYLAATGGLQALNAVHSMYAIGQVKMNATEFHMGDDAVKAKGNGEIGGFVLWQKLPDMWSLELVVSGSKLSAGSNGKVAWRQFAHQQSHASRGPPRPLRRFLQGLDPRATANLFADALCIGEKIINNEDCFILKLEASPASLEARSCDNFEIIHHTIWGYFSQRSGLLVQLEDSHLLRIQTKGDDSVFWETSMESVIDDYKYIEGINIAHSGKTMVTLFRYGEGSANHKRKMEETWLIEEVDFNVWGLSRECFLPPADLKNELTNGIGA